MNFEQSPQTSIASNHINTFEEQGYVIFKNMFSEEHMLRLWNSVNANLMSNDELLLAGSGRIMKNKEVKGDVLQDTVLRIINIEEYSEVARNVMLHRDIVSFLRAYLESKPIAIQTLTYQYSSEQGAHSDLYLVNPSSVGDKYERESLCAAWIACEKATDDNGALIIYPESHKILKKRYDAFEGDYTGYSKYLHEICASRGIHPEKFYAGVGDVLFWHGDFVHAGGPILDRTKTRKSLVVHYCRILEGQAPANPNFQLIDHSGGSYFRQK